MKEEILKCKNTIAKKQELRESLENLFFDVLGNTSERNEFEKFCKNGVSTKMIDLITDIRFAMDYLVAFMEGLNKEEGNIETLEVKYDIDKIINKRLEKILAVFNLITCELDKKIFEGE